MSEKAVESIEVRLRSFTPARVGLGRTGVSQQTRDVLDFQRAHAVARDAVHAALNVSALAGSIDSIEAARVVGSPLFLHSMAANRALYLQRPDLGRMLDESSREALDAHRQDCCDLVLIVADGLSAVAVERHAAAVLAALLPLLAGWRMAPVCIVEQGRVAIGDAIGETLGAELAVVLIGERPGLSSPDSLGAYVTWMPRRGRTDAERVCISNIRAEGLSYSDAATQLFSVLMEARRKRLTGVAGLAGARALGEGNAR
jgi:ethanolamine ammonia-lyase small subunit